MASKKPNKGKEPSGDTAGVQPLQDKKPPAHWTTENKELFIDLALEQIKIGNRPGKGFTPEGWKNIIAGFKDRTGITYDQAQFKNLYDKLRGSWQAWRGLIANTGMGYDPNAKTFTTDE